MKRLFAFFLPCAILLSLAACAAKPSAPEPTGVTVPADPPVDADAFRFTRENFPVIDGSTSMFPLGQGIASVLLGESRDSAADLISFNRTTQSFRNLREGLCDVVIAAEPNAAVFDEMRQSGFVCEIETIAKEALVFVVNEANPVSSLTAQQLRDIYAGKITNWKDVGGDNAPIEAFQRNATSGSQVMMEKLVMDGTPMMPAPTTNIPSEMGQLIQAVKSFDSSASAIGYTVFYYASDMKMAQGLKILKVDGVLPQPETLRDETYPFLNGYYCCISGQAAPDSPARRLYHWLVSEAGQTLLNLEGYVSVYDPGTAPASGSDVYVSYASYTPNGGTPPKFTELPGGTPEKLVASDSYGLIFPYTGSLEYIAYENDGYEYRSTASMGFYSQDGTLITKPSYQTITQSCINWDDPSEGYYWIMDVGTSPDDPSYTFAASDGSYVCDREYSSITTINGYLICEYNFGTGAFDVYDSNLRLCKTEKDFTINGTVYSISEIRDGLITCCHYDPESYEGAYYLMSWDGALLSGAWDYISLYDNGVVVYTDNSGKTLVEINGKPITFDGERWVGYTYPINKNFLSVTLLDDRRIVTDYAGNLYQWGFDYCNTTSDGGFSLVSGETFYYYDADGRLLYEPVSGGWRYLEIGDLFCQQTDSVLTIRNWKTGQEKYFPDASFAYQLNRDLVYVCGMYHENAPTRNYILDASLNIRLLDDDGLVALRDSVTGTPYLLQYGAYGFNGDQRFYSSNGKTELFRGTGNGEMTNGHFIILNDWAFTDYNPDGTVCFCYPYYGISLGD